MLALRFLGDAAAATLSTLACVEHAGPDLVDHPVPVVVDTAAWVAAGELDPACADLRVTDLAGGALPFWVEDATCDTAATTVWVGLATVPAGQTSVVLVRSDVPVGPGGDGRGVFPLFEDFSDPATFPGARWVFRGDGEGEVAGGVLRTDPAPLAMYSADPALEADRTALVARVDATGGYLDDVEVGGGVIAAGPLWRGSRSWYGFTHLSWDEAYYTASDGTTPGPSCLDRSYSQPWLPVRGQDPRSWVRLEVRYDSAGGSTLALDGAPPIVRSGAAGCVPAAALPVLLVFDHDPGGANPSQRVDFLFVRPTADPEPIAAVVGDDPDLDGIPSGIEGCADGDGDGVPDWDDPDPPLDTGSGNGGDGGTGGGPVDTGTRAGGAPTRQPPESIRDAVGATVGCGCRPGAAPGGLGVLAAAVLGVRARRRSRPVDRG